MLTRSQIYIHINVVLLLRIWQSNLRELALSGHVGFDSLPDQLVNKSVSQGFAFNILCVGE